MSDYRREQLLTYVGGPILILCGLVALTIVGSTASNAVSIAQSIDGAFAASLLTTIEGAISVAYVYYGIYVIREGRRRLSSDHWRAEHFM